MTEMRIKIDWKVVLALGVGAFLGNSYTYLNAQQQIQIKYALMGVFSALMLGVIILVFAMLIELAKTDFDY
jgi:hypothetical protein